MTMVVFQHDEIQNLTVNHYHRVARWGEEIYLPFSKEMLRQHGNFPLEFYLI